MEHAFLTLKDIVVGDNSYKYPLGEVALREIAAGHVHRIRMGFRLLIAK
jgi:hypothetical protein